MLTVLNVTSESTYSRYRPQFDEMYLYVSKSKQGDSIFTNIQSEFIRRDEFTIALLCSSILKDTSVKQIYRILKINNNRNNDHKNQPTTDSELLPLII